MKQFSSDILIVGSGAAGLFAALSLAPRRVLVVSEQPPGGICASAWSQGGIAAAVGEGDSAFSHATDTLKAGAGTTDRHVARVITEEAPRHVELLENLGVRFEKDADGNFALSREACHARRRVLKAAAADGFGRELMRALAAAALAAPSITFLSGVAAERLIADGGRLRGLSGRDVKTGEQVVISAPAVLLATGGIGGLYAATTNPLQAVGRGIAMAALAGAELSDLEFVQFHPTALDLGEDPAPLATEALRGEGAKLVNGQGRAFMTDYHEMAELAPRDEVSRAIFAEMQKGQRVYLDCRALDLSRFPALLSACARAGFDPARDLIPVSPAVHYHMGGINTDLAGRTSLPGLWAAGECAATGLHGANRLASNSLLEAVVMGGRAARDIAAAGLKAIGPAQAERALPDFPLPALKDEVRQVMSDFVGVIRDASGLAFAIARLEEIRKSAEPIDGRTADMALVAGMIAKAALAREESRGGHCRADFPHTRPEWQRRSFTRLAEPAAVEEAMAT